MSVNVIVDRRCASVIDSGTVYGPPPTRNVGPGGEISTCAEPMPGDCVGTAAGAAAGGVPAGAAGGGAAAVGSVVGGTAAAPGSGGGVGAAGAAGGGFGFNTVPGTGELPGGTTTVGLPGTRWVPAPGCVPAGS